LTQCNYFGARSFGILASYYTTTLLYSNLCSPLSNLPGSKNSRHKGLSEKKLVLHYTECVGQGCRDKEEMMTEEAL